MDKLYTKGLVSLALTAALAGCGGGSDPLPPVAISETVSVNEDNSVSFTLSGTAKNNGTLSFSVTGQPSNGTISVSGANVTYTPNENFFGADSISFSVKEGALSGTGKISVNVAAVNDAPTVVATNFSLDEDGEYQGQLVGEDVDDTVLAYHIEQAPSQGTLTLEDDGKFTYTPNADYFGDDSFSFTASDSELKSVAATTLITVDSVNDLPVFSQTSLALTLNAGEKQSVSLPATDVETQALTYRVTTAQQADITVAMEQADAPDVMVETQYGAWGEHTYLVEVEDADAGMAQAQIDLTITVPDSEATLTEINTDTLGNISDALAVVEHQGHLYAYVRTNGDFTDAANKGSFPKPYLVKYTLAGEFVSATLIADSPVNYGDVSMASVGDEVQILSVFGSTQMKGAPVSSYALFMTLDTATGLTSILKRDLPFNAEHSSVSHRVGYLDTLGFVVVSNDGHTHIVNTKGELSASILPQTGARSDVSTVYLRDLVLSGDTLYTLAGGFNCGGSEDCNGGLGTKTLMTQVDLTANTSALTLLENRFPKDAALDEQGNAYIFDNNAVFAVSASGDDLWTHSFEGDFFYSGVSFVRDDVFVFKTTYNDTANDTVLGTAARLNKDGSVVWQTDLDVPVSGYLFSSQAIVDDYGNLYFVASDNQEYEAGNTYMKLLVSHVDYTGKAQWSKRSEGKFEQSSGYQFQKPVFTSNGDIILMSDDAGAASMAHLSIKR